MAQYSFDKLVDMEEEYPKVIRKNIEELPSVFEFQLNSNQLDKFHEVGEVWTIPATSRDLSYSTHGVFRYFGKFPPPIASYLVERHSDPKAVIFDCMSGSGTTGVECIRLGRQALLMDINPFSVLVSRVKTTHIPLAKSFRAIDRVGDRALAIHGNNGVPELPGLKDPNHFFLQETLEGLAALREAIQTEDDEVLRDLLMLGMLTIVRKVSRITSQQGRLFLDKKSAVKDVFPDFLSEVKSIAVAVDNLPAKARTETIVGSTLDRGSMPENIEAPLVICHPPYFNNYRFSRIFSLELAWLGISNKEVLKNEVREAFKSGHPDKLPKYIHDMRTTLENLRASIKGPATLGLMIGDTQFRGEYLSVTRQVIDEAEGLGFSVESLAYRVPYGTEASWVASQRRSSNRLGVSMCDYVVTLRFPRDDT